MSVRKIFGDLTVQGNAILFQNLTVQGTTTNFYGNIVASSSTIGLGNVATPFGNLFTINSNWTSVNTQSLFTDSFQTINIAASNALTTTNVIASSANVPGAVNTGSLIVQSNIGIGTRPTGNTLEISGNFFASNALTTTNLFVNSSNIGSVNLSSLNFVSNIGIGTAPVGNVLAVQGNAFVSNSLTTTNVTVTTLNVAGTGNTSSILVQNSIGLSGANVNVLGNAWVSNALSTTNVFGSTMNLTTANVSTFNVSSLNVYLYATSTTGINATTLNTVSIYGQSGLVGINTGTNLGAALQVPGNVYASNAFSGSNFTASGTITYNEDLFKRGPYLTPDSSNASQIQAWISATCNATYQTRTRWAVSPKPVYGNVAVGPQGATDYSGSVFLPDGRVLFVPRNASNVGFYNPATRIFSTVNVPGITAQTDKFRGGVLVPNGNVVFVPYGISNVGLFNPLTYAFSNIQIGATGTNPFQGGLLSPTGNVIMTPRDSANIGVFNPTTLTMANVGPIAGLNSTLFGSSVLLPNGNVVMSPIVPGGNIGMYNTYSLSATGFTNVGPVGSTGTWESATLAPNGNVIFGPYNGGNVLVYNPTFVSSPISAGGFSNIIAAGIGSGALQGSTLLPSGNVIFVPRNTSNVGMFDPVALTYSNCAQVGGVGIAKFSGCSLVPSGQVVFVPSVSKNVGVLSTLVPAPREFCLNPLFNKF